MYAGDIKCADAYKILQDNSASALVDVRTHEEWETIGKPDLSSCGKDVIFIEWKSTPAMQVNPEFVSNTDQALKNQNITKNDPIYLLCRTGVRSKAAAAAITAIGYKQAFNLVDGFEGNKNGAGERSTLDGWVFEGLPVERRVMHE